MPVCVETSKKMVRLFLERRGLPEPFTQEVLIAWLAGRM